MLLLRAESLALTEREEKNAVALPEKETLTRLVRDLQKKPTRKNLLTSMPEVNRLGA